jgi:RNA polymerase, sigma 32 subunit, RpoH
LTAIEHHTAMLSPEEHPDMKPDTTSQPDVDQASVNKAEAGDAKIASSEKPDKAEGFMLPALKDKRSGQVVPSDPLQLYLREISRFPMLKPEEEQELAQRVRENGDQDAAFRLVSSHLRLVVKIAMEFQRRWMQNVLDLIQEGNVGLMKAVNKFDPDKGIKFSYYAAFWIKAYILKYIMDNWRMVKIGTTQTQRKLFYNLNKERQRLLSLGFNPTTEALSESLNVSESEIVEMDQRLSRGDMSLDMPMSDDTDSTRLDFLPSLAPGVEETLSDNQISSILLKNLKAIEHDLNDKELAILNERLLSDSPVTLREIGERFGVTRERVRQIEARLLQKIRQHLEETVDDFSVEWINKDE